jgi:hypothetical protein
MAGDAPLLGLSAAPLGLPFGGSESTGVALVLKIEEQRYKPWTITNYSSISIIYIYVYI